MIIERFLNTALFFNGKTSQLDTIKLYKLMFLVDRDAIRKTGHTISGCSIYRKIKPWGPIPREAKTLVDGMASGDQVDPPISSVLAVEKQGKNTHIELTGEADLSYFTREEISILEKVAKKYARVPGKKIAHGVHEMRIIKTMAWEKDFHMDAFLSPEKQTASRANRNVAEKLRLTPCNAH